MCVPYSAAIGQLLGQVEGVGQQQLPRLQVSVDGRSGDTHIVLVRLTHKTSSLVFLHLLCVCLFVFVCM